MGKAQKVELWEQRPRKRDEDCERCVLHKNCETTCVPGEGSPNAKIMLVGEAPGQTEDRRGRPFVGDSGRKLGYLFQRLDLKRKKLYLTNTVRCRPPQNDKPAKKHITACVPYLLYDILKVKPKVIVAAGAIAVETILGKPHNDKLSKRRGYPVWHEFKWASKKGKVHTHACWVIPTYHPSAALRGGGWVYDDLIEFDLDTAVELAAGRQKLQQPDTKIHVVKEKDIDGALALIRKMKAYGAYVLDLETTGLHVHSDRVLCLGFCAKEGEAHVLPLVQQFEKPYWSAFQYRKIIAALTDLFESTIIWGQNIKFDFKFLRKLTGIREFNCDFDTMAAQHCLDENKPNNLSFMAQWYLRWDRYDEVMKQYAKKVGDKWYARYHWAPNQILWKYQGYDVDATFRIRKLQLPLLRANNLMTAFRTELGLINPLADVEYRGIRVNRERMEELVAENHEKAEAALLWMREQAEDVFGEQDKVFNPNSQHQLAKFLKEIETPLEKKTKKGNISTDKNVLAKLALRDDYYGEVARTMQDLRKANKLLSTYLDGSSIEGGKKGVVFKKEIKGFLRHVSVYDRIYPSFNVSRTVTGRLSANDPPVQTLPRKGGLRNIFIPDVPGRHVMLSCDYAKIELCVMAWLANDWVMVNELVSGMDLHSRMALAMRLNRDPTDEEFFAMISECEKEPGWKNERAIAKAVNFGIPYGRSAKGIVEANPDAFPDTMEDSERIRIVQNMMDAYFDKYQGIAEYLDKQVKTAHKKGVLRTVFTGRKRRLSGTDWFYSKWGMACKYRNSDLEQLNREAKNFKIQSIASDELSKATARVHAGIQKAGIPGFRILLTLHDQLLYNCPKTHIEEAAELIPQWMETTLKPDRYRKFEVPLRVDVDVQEFWGEGEYEGDKRELSDETKEEIKQAKADGVRCTAIAERYDIPISQAWSI